MDVPKLPTCFPRAPSACRKDSEPFFNCLNANSEKSSDDDTDAGKRGLQACVKEMKAYEKCMETYEAKKPLRQFRVQEEYRLKTPSS
jgi:hypothetical protein